MAGEVVVDALPYYDHGYDESGIREAVCIDLYHEKNLNQSNINLLSIGFIPNGRPTETDQNRAIIGASHKF